MSRSTARSLRRTGERRRSPTRPRRCAPCSPTTTSGAWSPSRDGALAGQVTILPAARAPHPVPGSALAHLRNLFVERDFWGTGLARTLNAAAVEAARERGYEELRLFTPARQDRARRFYEREGWVQVGEPFHDPGPDLALVEYRYALRSERPAASS